MMRLVVVGLLMCVGSFAADVPPVHASEDADSVQLDNEFVALHFSKESGTFTAIRRYRDGKLEDVAVGPEAYYWDSNTEPDGAPAGVEVPNKGYFRPAHPALRVISRVDAAEIVASVAHTSAFPFDVELHYLLRRGDTGFYAYAVVRHPATLSAATFHQTRFVSKTSAPDELTDFVIGDDRIRNINRSEVQKQLMDATYLLADGTVKTKYQNSSYWADTLVYGSAGKRLGIWSITASPEYHNGGPLKQGQTVHDNVLLRVMQSVHFGATPVAVAAGEQWSKVYGPVFTYINDGNWDDAKQRQQAEAERWPYSWVTAPEYAKQRGTVTGQWKLKGETARTGAWVVLAQPGSDWTQQSKSYQFWARTGPDGKFTIRNVIPGRYTLYVSGADQPEQFARDGVDVAAGRSTAVDVEWSPVRHGETLWQIGTFDRTAAEFRNGNDARQFEMFRRYPVDFPEDVVFTVGRSDAAKDWNYAQWTWYAKRPVWTIRFDAATPPAGDATLTIGFASAQPLSGPRTRLQVKVNGTLIETIGLPKTGTAGYRGSMQDSQYNLRVLHFDAKLLHAGTNEITLGHADAQPFPSGNPGSRVGQVMYDALRLEVR
jgi:rhamnogalacturonan endolyase